MSFASVESRIVSTAMASGVESRGAKSRPRGLDTSRYPDAGQMAETTRLEYVSKRDGENLENGRQWS